MSSELALDILEAKELLASSSRPAVQEVLGAFIAEATKKELAGLSGGQEEEAAPKQSALEAADLLEPAPLKKVDENAMAPVSSEITAPPPTKLMSSHGVVKKAEGMEWAVPGYGWEQGEYNSPWVNVMVSIDGVGAAKERTTCDFRDDAFDLKIVDVQGKNYRLLIEPLDKDILPDESKVLVKKNRVTIKLKKKKGEYSYDHWTDLKKKGGRAAKEKEKNRDPTAGIMDMMKDLYDTGDDKMRKIIGESMLKSRRGEKMDDADTLAKEDPDYSSPDPFPTSL